MRQIVFISAFGVNFNEQAAVAHRGAYGDGFRRSLHDSAPQLLHGELLGRLPGGGIKGAGGISLAAGDGKTSFISVRDIAAVALAAFKTPLTGQELDLTGPEALDHAEVAKIVGDAAGHAVAYRALTEEQMVAGARGMGMPESAIGYLTVLYGVVRAGYSAAVTPVVETVTGHKRPASANLPKRTRRRGNSAALGTPMNPKWRQTAIKAEWSYCNWQVYAAWTMGGPDETEAGI